MLYKVCLSEGTFLFELGNTEIDKLQVFCLDLLHKRISTVIKEHVLALLDNKEKSFYYLHLASVGWLFMSRSHLTPSVVKALYEVLKNESTPRNLEDEGIRKYYKKGWLHSEILNFKKDEVICVFPTRLHTK